MHAGMALAERGLFLAHAMAQALGGRYGLPHGAMNAICLAAGAPLQRAGRARRDRALRRRRSAPTMPPARVEELARLGGFERLRDFGVPEDELGRASRRRPPQRPGARANPRPATPTDIEALLRSVW